MKPLKLDTAKNTTTTATVVGIKIVYNVIDMT